MPESHSHAAYLEETRKRIVASPAYQTLGLEILELAHGRARLSMPARPEYHQLYSMTHGGLLAALADSCIGCAFITLIPPSELALTVELKVNFIAPLAAGEAIGEGRIIHKGRTIGFGEAEVRDGEGRLLATASATYLAKRSRPQSSPG